MTLAAEAIEQEQEGHMELISRMMDGSVSYDGLESVFESRPRFRHGDARLLRTVRWLVDHLANS